MVCRRRVTGGNRKRSPEASSVSSVTSCATHAAVPHHVPGGAASDHPCHLRDPWSSPRHGVIPFLTKSNHPASAKAGITSPLTIGHHWPGVPIRDVGCAGNGGRPGACGRGRTGVQSRHAGRAAHAGFQVLLFQSGKATSPGTYTLNARKSMRNTGWNRSHWRSLKASGATNSR